MLCRAAAKAVAAAAAEDDEQEVLKRAGRGKGRGRKDGGCSSRHGGCMAAARSAAPDQAAPEGALEGPDLDLGGETPAAGSRMSSPARRGRQGTRSSRGRGKSRATAGVSADTGAIADVGPKKAAACGSLALAGNEAGTDRLLTEPLAPSDDWCYSPLQPGSPAAEAGSPYRPGSKAASLHASSPVIAAPLAPVEDEWCYAGSWPEQPPSPHSLSGSAQAASLDDTYTRTGNVAVGARQQGSSSGRDVQDSRQQDQHAEEPVILLSSSSSSSSSSDSEAEPGALAPGGMLQAQHLAGAAAGVLHKRGR